MNVRGAAWRLGVATCGTLILETLAALLLQPIQVVDAVSFLADLTVRWGRLWVLGLPALMVLAVARRSAGPLPMRLARAVEASMAWMCVPTRAIRLAVVFSVAVVICTMTVGRRYDLAWRAGAVFALAPLALAMLVELAVGAARRSAAKSAPRPSSLVGRLIWTLVLAFLGLGVFARILGFEAASAAVFVAAWFVVPVPKMPRSQIAIQLAAAGAVLAAGAGLAIDANVPSLRRFVSVQAPFSNAGLIALRWMADLDRDGSSGAFGLDCDDLDSHRAPMLDDLPDDGRDQNCTGHDGLMIRTIARFAPGGIREPWPPSQPTETPIDIVLITVDALRYDALYPRHGKTLLPRTRQWATKGHRFQNARTNANFTDIALLALFAGVLPRHAREGHALRGAPGEEERGRLSIPPTLASVLRAKGYATAAVAAIQPLRPYLRFGFESVDVPDGDEWKDTPATEVLALAKRRLAESPPEAPSFLWAHLIDAHAPYGGGATREAYERTVRSIDLPLASFLEDLPADTLVVLASDHGEAFGEHGAYTHGNRIFDEELRVPLIVLAPERLGLGPPREVETPVGLIDVMPTVLDLVGLDAPYPRHGESLVPHLQNGEPLRTPWVVVEVWIPHSHKQGIIDGRWKWVRDLDLGWEALFDLETDPDERRDLSRAEPEEFQRLRSTFFRILDDDLDSYRSWRMGERSAQPASASAQP